MEQKRGGIMAKNPLMQTEINDLLFKFRDEFVKCYNIALESAYQPEVDDNPYALAKIALIIAAEEIAADDGGSADRIQKKILSKTR
jgi:hypothetical protein